MMDFICLYIINLEIYIGKEKHIMTEYEKMIHCSKVLYGISKNEFTLSQLNASIWRPDDLYAIIICRKIDYGILSHVSHETMIIFPECIYIFCPYQLSDVDRFLLHYIHQYSKIIYFNTHPLLPAPKIFFKEKTIRFVEDILQWVREVSQK